MRCQGFKLHLEESKPKSLIRSEEGYHCRTAEYRGNYFILESGWELAPGEIKRGKPSSLRNNRNRLMPHFGWLTAMAHLGQNKITSIVNHTSGGYITTKNRRTS